MILDRPSGGFFVTFEGGEGSGKSTQSRRLADYCARHQIDYVLTREPGGCETAEKIRALLVQGNSDFDAVTELLLVNAARVEHVCHVIRPALLAGKLVICDRFVDSTIAYQGAGRGLGADMVQDWHQRLMTDFYPDLTFYLNIPAGQGLARSGGGGRNEDRFEKVGLAFHQRIHDAFDQMAAHQPDRFVVLDANDPIETLHDRIVAAVRSLLARK